MSDYPMLISNKLHSFRNFRLQFYKKISGNPKGIEGTIYTTVILKKTLDVFEKTLDVFEKTLDVFKNSS